MTPTPEDITLAEEIADSSVCDGGGYHYDIAARVIAAHCAPLRELAEIGRLAVEHRRMGVTAVGAGTWYDKLTEINTACDAHLAKQEEPKP